MKQAFVLAVMSTVPGCGDTVTTPPTQQDDAFRLSVTSATLTAGESLQIEVKAGGAVSWESSDPAVVVVSADGVAAALTEGDAEITARSGDKVARAKMKVKGPKDESAPDPTADPAPTPDPTPAPTPTPTPAQGSPAFQDGFEAGAHAPTSNGYGWKGTGTGMSRDVARSGAYSMKFTYAGNPDPCADAWSEQRFELGENLREVWLEYYVYLPSGSDGRGPKFVHRAPRCTRDKDPDGVVNNNKFFALWDLNYGNVNTMFLLEYRRRNDHSSYVYNMWGGRGTAYVQQHNGTEGAGEWNGFLTDEMRGRWVQVRIHARLSDSKEASNGLVEVWFDGVRRINETGIALMSTDPAGNFFRNGYLMGWANSGFDQATSMYVDDFKIFRSKPW
jgi:hypothetical protein